MKSSTQCNSIITKDRLQATGSETAIVVGPASNRPPSGINVIRDGESVEAIEVTCECGQTTRIVCKY